MMVAAALAAACVAVSGANITAGDLAKALPSFTPADPAAVIAYAPFPGVHRIFHAAEIRQTLQRFGAETNGSALSDICFERQTTVLSADAVSEAMHRALGSEAQIEIVEVSKFPAPPGEIVFPLQALGLPPIALWEGYVRYDGDKKFRIWARARITTRTARLVAREELQLGVPIRAAQVALESVNGFPEKRTTPASPEQAEGWIPHRTIPANSPVWQEAIDPPLDISKGDQVTVTIHSGLAQLRVGAEAQASGRRGDLLVFKNPESGKTFRARVEGPGKAGVVTPQVKP